jgi:hypothetical protein
MTDKCSTELANDFLASEARYRDLVQRTLCFSKTALAQLSGPGFRIITNRNYPPLCFVGEQQAAVSTKEGFDVEGCPYLRSVRYDRNRR